MTLSLRASAAAAIALALPAVAAAEGADAAPALHSGPAFQFEGQWAVTERAADGTERIVASCAAPVTLSAENGETLVHANMARRFAVARTADTTLHWKSGGMDAFAMEPMGNMFLLTMTAPEGGKRMAAYHRCGQILPAQSGRAVAVAEAEADRGDADRSAVGAAGEDVAAPSIVRASAKPVAAVEGTCSTTRVVTAAEAGALPETAVRKAVPGA